MPNRDWKPPKHKCATPSCQNLCKLASKHCLQCGFKARRKNFPRPCPGGCGKKIKVRSKICLTCANKLRRIKADKRHVCPDCKGPKARLDAIRCRKCAGKAVTKPKPICPDCKGPRSRGAKRCKPCSTAYSIDNNRLVKGFSAEWFKSLLKTEHMEWDVHQISAACKGQVDASTMLHWLNGTSIPRQSSWDIVRRVLALEPCEHCGGTGWSDPVGNYRRILPPRSDVPATNDRRHGWYRPEIIKERVVMADGTIFDPSRMEVCQGKVVVELSPRERDILALGIEHADNRWTNVYEIAQKGGFNSHAFRVSAARLKKKLADEDIDTEGWWKSGGIRGWLFVTLEQGEKAS